MCFYSALVVSSFAAVSARFWPSCKNLEGPSNGPVGLQSPPMEQVHCILAYIFTNPSLYVFLLTLRIVMGDGDKMKGAGT